LKLKECSVFRLEKIKSVFANVFVSKPVQKCKTKL
jgi:hypothetical protein